MLLDLIQKENNLSQLFKTLLLSQKV